MPGGYLTFGIYQALGGERAFGSFWKEIGLPTILFIATCYVTTVRSLAIMSQQAWMISSLVVIAMMAMAVVLRMIH